MTDTCSQPQNKQNEPINRPSCSSSPKKRLLAEAKPEQASATASPRESVLSSDSSSDRFKKKTRELPNLSDCHSCGLRINNTNPEDRLQTLDSVWRIVLLCNKCVTRVGLGQTCPYCFMETSEKEKVCFQCCNCKRQIHKDCFVNYGSSAPWSYCGSDLRFSVCIDCWVPKLLADSIRVSRMKKKKIVREPCDTTVAVTASRVSLNSNNIKSLEEVVKDASCVLERKVAVAAKAKENELGKALVAKRAVELASNALDLVAKKDDEDGGKSGCLVTSSSSSTANSVDTFVDDAELAFRLHRAINSSPRISKNLCSLNSSCLVVPKTRDWRAYLSGKRSDSRGSITTSVRGRLEICTNSKSAEKLDRTVPEPLVCSVASDSGIDLDTLKLEVKTYARRARLKVEECQDNGEIGLAVGIVRKCDSGEDNRMNSESQSYQEPDNSRHELHRNDTKTECVRKCGGNNTRLQDGQCKSKPDRFLLKYRKRPLCSKGVSNRATKLLYDAFDLENLTSSAGLYMNCSKESRTFSDPSF